MPKKTTADDPIPTFTLIGATDTSLPLTDGTTTTEVTVGDAFSHLRGDEQGRTYLNLESIVGGPTAPTYEVYVGAEDDPSGSYAGLLPPFGAAEATDSDGGGGLTIVLNITDIVAQLRQTGSFQSGRLRVAFVPVGPSPHASHLRVGRISVYYG